MRRSALPFCSCCRDTRYLSFIRASQDSTSSSWLFDNSISWQVQNKLIITLKAALCNPAVQHNFIFVSNHRHLPLSHLLPAPKYTVEKSGLLRQHRGWKHKTTLLGAQAVRQNITHYLSVKPRKDNGRGGGVSAHANMGKLSSMMVLWRWYNLFCLLFTVYKCQQKWCHTGLHSVPLKPWLIVFICLDIKFNTYETPFLCWGACWESQTRWRGKDGWRWSEVEGLKDDCGTP